MNTPNFLTSGRLTLGAAIAAILFALTAAPASAVQQLPVEDPCGNGCEEVDLTPGKTGWPTLPGQEEELVICGGQLNGLRVLTPSDIAALSADATVEIMRICPGRPVGGAQEGLADLKSAIEASPALSARLQRAYIGSDKVVGIALGQNRALLYVHY
jgi:hypothetical protein